MNLFVAKVPVPKEISDRYPGVVLKKGREVSLLRYHPWIFSGAIQKINGNPANGDVVEVFSSAGEYLGTGLYEKSSLAIRIFSFQRAEINQAFWTQKLQQAIQLRESLGLVNNEATNAYRLVFTEADAMPGLIIDFYNGVAVFQAQLQGMFNQRQLIAEALKSIYGSNLKAVYDKSADSFFDPAKGSNPKDRFLFGQAVTPVEIVENGNKFLVDFIEGQKTGFFIDQRENRKLLITYAKGRKTLNLFSYTGGFSVYALKGGASEVYSVDSSAKAIEMANENIKRNGLNPEDHHGIVEDVKHYVQHMAGDFNLIILDPPAFAKHMDSRHRAMQGYRFLNSVVMKKIKAGGILFTFSCSQVVSSEMFESVVLAAAIESGRNIRILHRLAQAPDHPVNIYQPEGAYLKGLVLAVD